MTQEEILQYNKLCAEFLGYHFYNKEITFGRSEESKPTILPNFIEINEKEYQLPSLKFHSDWNWIMEVVEAIEKLGYEFRGWSNIYYIVDSKNNSDVVAEESGNLTKKEAVVQAINQFLIWYEQNKTT